MTQWILPPKQLNWTKTLEQRYSSNRTIGIVSGSSFTAGTDQLKMASSWPGYVYERCGLEKIIDLSFPATNNQYISDSTINYLESISQQEKNNLYVAFTRTKRFLYVSYPQKRFIQSTNKNFNRNIYRFLEPIVNSI